MLRLKPERRVALIAETPSLAAALHELLDAERIPVSEVHTLQEAQVLRDGPQDNAPSILMAASNRSRCDSAREWAQGSLHSLPLVVVGSRDPTLKGSRNLHVIPLPMDPKEVLSLVHALLDAEAEKNP